MNAAVEAQVTQRWVSDADAALQQWLSARGLASVVSASVTSTTQNLGSLNDDIDAQTVDDWVATENGGIAAWLQARGYDGAVPVASVQLDASDTSARVSGYPAYPASVNSAVQTAVEQDWIADAESDLRSWLVTKNYDGFVTTSDVFITITSPNLAQINAVIETKVEQDWIDSTDAELQLWLSSNGYGDVVATVDDVAENFPTLNEDIETQAKADWVADAQAELTRFVLYFPNPNTVCPYKTDTFFYSSQLFNQKRVRVRDRRFRYFGYAKLEHLKRGNRESGRLPVGN